MCPTISAAAAIKCHKTVVVINSTCYSKDMLPAVTKHHHPLTGTKLYCLVTEAYECEKVVGVVT